MTSRLLKVSQQAYGFSNLQSTRSVIRMLGLPPEKGRSLKKKIEGNRTFIRLFRTFSAFFNFISETGFKTTTALYRPFTYLYCCFGYFTTLIVGLVAFSHLSISFSIK